MDTDDFEEIATLMRRCDLRCSDFGDILGACGKGDLAFVDPPYTVKHNMNGFVKYNETLFSWEDQVRLRDAVVSATSRGAKIIVTNADHPSVRTLSIDRSEHPSRRCASGPQLHTRGQRMVHSCSQDTFPYMLNVCDICSSCFMLKMQDSHHHSY